MNIFANWREHNLNHRLLRNLKNDYMRLEFLLRLAAIEGKAASASELEALKSAHGELLANRATIDSATAIINAIGTASNKVSNKEVMKSSPLLSTTPSQWSTAKLWTVISVLGAMFMVVFASTYFNQVKVSHDSIAEILSEKVLQAVFLANDDVLGEEDKELHSMVGRIQLISLVEIRHVESLIIGSGFLVNFIHYSIGSQGLGNASEIDDSVKNPLQTGIGMSANAQPANMPSVKTFTRESKPPPDDLRDAATRVTGQVGENPKNFATMATLFPNHREAALYLMDKRRTLESMMSLLGTSILPMLYGFFGASVYLLRSLLPNRELFAHGELSTVDVLLRLGLGTVAGLTVGWFNLTSNVSELTTTPFAVAFLAGFSLDLVFSVLERLVTAFSTTGSTPKVT